MFWPYLPFEEPSSLWIDLHADKKFRPFGPSPIAHVMFPTSFMSASWLAWRGNSSSINQWPCANVTTRKTMTYPWQEAWALLPQFYVYKLCSTEDTQQPPAIVTTTTIKPWLIGLSNKRLVCSYAQDSKWLLLFASLPHSTVNCLVPCLTPG